MFWPTHTNATSSDPPLPIQPRAVNTNDGFVGIDSDNLNMSGSSKVFPPAFDAGEFLLQCLASNALLANSNHAYFVDRAVSAAVFLCATHIYFKEKLQFGRSSSWFMHVY